MNLQYYNFRKEGPGGPCPSPLPPLADQERYVFRLFWKKIVSLSVIFKAISVIIP